MTKQQIRQRFADEIIEVRDALVFSGPQAKYKYETVRHHIIYEYGYSVFFDIQSCAFEDLFSKIN